MEISKRLMQIFLTDKQGRRPIFGYSKKLQEDPEFNKHILFHEYFHGDDGSGLGASHQTGWTGLVANLIGMVAQVDSVKNNKVERKMKTAEIVMP